VLQACARKAVYLVRPSALPRRGAARQLELCYRVRPDHHCQGATGTVTAARRDVDPERLPDGPEGRCSVGIVGVHRRDACLAARLAGLGRVPKGLQDEQEIVDRALQRRQDAAHRVPQPQDVLRWVRPARHQASEVAVERPVWVRMARALLQWVSQQQAMMPVSWPEPFRVAQQQAQHRPAELRDELPQVALTALRRGDARFLEPAQNLAGQFRVLPSALV
jgi:hypothetical protein